MPQTPHLEIHFTASNIVRDVVIGMADGLTVPFALAAGLTGAINTVGIIVTAGLAEIAAGSIAMAWAATSPQRAMRNTTRRSGGANSRKSSRCRPRR
jgi:hypothetical protein